MNFKDIRPVGKRLIVDTAVTNEINEVLIDNDRIAEDEHLHIRRSAQIHTKDIRHPDIIRMIMDDFEGMARFNYVVPLTQEFIDTYLEESEADERVRVANNDVWFKDGKAMPHEAVQTIPLWQPMIDGKPVGEKVSAKHLYVKMGGTLCAEIRLPSRPNECMFKIKDE